MATANDIPMIKWAPGTASPEVDRFFARPAFPPAAEKAARKVLKDVRERGDCAVRDAMERFDKVRLPASRFHVSPKEIVEAREWVDADFKRAVRESIRRVSAFSREGMRKDWSMPSPRGGTLGETFAPLDRVGVYIPGGKAPLVSTSIMTVTLARVAGVKQIVVCTPCDAEGRVNPYMLYAIDRVGATEIYRLGGIQAIGAMAYGTRTIEPVQKIVGPGNAYVTAAKRQVYGIVDLDLVAGPSEIAILADSTANPRHISMDLLSQLEHGTGDEKALLITTSAAVARRVQKQVAADAPTLPRGPWLQTVLAKNILIVVVKTATDATALCNRFAPEHLELLVQRPTAWLKRIRAAGAVFLGPYTPESAGDFAAGPSHVLPTGGTAAMFSGLTVDAFRRRTSIIGLTKSDLRDVLPVIEAFGRVEDLDAHAQSARVRFE